MSSPTPSRDAPLFRSTRWSLVLKAKDDASPDFDEAISALCKAYWYPLYAYVRRQGHGPHDAQDLTQEFFARLLEKDWLRTVAPERGRFRTFLLMAMKRFLAKEWHRAAAQKRGGGLIPVPLDPEDAEQRYAVEPALGADEIFERRWAMTLLDQTMERLHMEFLSAERAEEFEHLKDWLTASRGEIPYAELAVQIGSSEGAARVAVHRLRKRFRAIFRETVAETVADEKDIEEEMRHLIVVLSRGV